MVWGSIPGEPEQILLGGFFRRAIGDFTPPRDLLKMIRMGPHQLEETTQSDGDEHEPGDDLKSKGASGCGVLLYRMSPALYSRPFILFHAAYQSLAIACCASSSDIAPPQTARWRK